MEINMPSFGMSMKEGKVAKWLKEDGKAVTKGEAIVQITTEKLSNELEAPESGTLKILAEEGTVIECGEEIAEIN